MQSHRSSGELLLKFPLGVLRFGWHCVLSPTHALFQGVDQVLGQSLYPESGAPLSGSPSSEFPPFFSSCQGLTIPSLILHTRVATGISPSLRALAAQHARPRLVLRPDLETPRRSPSALVPAECQRPAPLPDAGVRLP